MIGFFENKKRTDEVKKLISSVNGIKFYGEPTLDKKYNRYCSSIVLDYSHPDWSVSEKKLRKLFDKWRIEDIKGGVLDKVEFGYSRDWNDKWYISRKNFDELVALGLKVRYPLHHADALRFLEGICNGAVYNEDCSNHSPLLKKRVDDRFSSIWNDPEFKHTIEHCYRVAHVCVDEAIEIVKKKLKIKN